MLPRFPNSQKISDEEFHKRMFAAMHKVFPRSIHPPVQAIIEGKSSDFQREDRKIMPLEIKKHEAVARVDTSDGKGTNWEILDQKAKELGESMGKQQFEMLMGAINEAVAETGNEIKIHTYPTGQGKEAGSL